MSSDQTQQNFGKHIELADAARLQQGSHALAGAEHHLVEMQCRQTQIAADRVLIFLIQVEALDDLPGGLDLFERDLVKNQDLRMMCQQIRTIDSDIALRREEIEGLRKPGGPTEGGIEREHIEEAEDEIIRG